MKKLLFITLIGIVCAAFSVAVFAHPTGNERRTKAQCKLLKKKKKRQACIVCVTRPKPHHFHPAKKPGHRCRPNNGQP